MGTPENPFGPPVGGGDIHPSGPQFGAPGGTELDQGGGSGFSGGGEFYPGAVPHGQGPEWLTTMPGPSVARRGRRPGEAAIKIRPGDVVDLKNDEWHSRGAAQDHLMTHLSLTEGNSESGDHVKATSTGAIE